jgi:polar amino acid transport system substrate-binding protein
MFVAFSKKSPCRSLADKFGQEITVVTTNDGFDKMLIKAVADWERAEGMTAK